MITSLALVLSVSIFIRVVALILAIILLRRMRDWRMGFLALMLGLMGLRQTLTLYQALSVGRADVVPATTEVPGLVVSILALLTVLFLERLLVQRQREPQALRESEERYRDLYEEAPHAYFSIGVDGRIQMLNRRAVELLGYTRDDLVGRPVLDLYADTPAGKDNAQEVLARFRAGEDIRGEELEMRRADGSSVWVSLTVQPIRDAQGQIVQSRSMVVNITERVRADEEIRRRAKEQAALLEVSEALATTLDLETVLQTSINGAIDLMELGSGAIYLLEGETLYLGATTPPLPPQFPEELRRAPLSDHPHIHEALTTGRPVILPDTTTADLTPAERAVSEARGLRSIVYAPLMVAEQAVGALILATTGEPRGFSEAEIDLCRTLSSQMALAVENARLYEQVQRRLGELTAIHQAGQQLQRLHTPETLLQDIIQILEEILDYDYGAVLLIDESTNRLIPFALSDQGRGPAFVEADKAYVESHGIRLGMGITGWVAQTGQSVCVGDVRLDPRYHSLRDDIRSELCVPLRTGDEILGIINVETPRPNAYTEADQRVLETVAAQIATALQNARLYESIQRHAAELEQRVAERTAELNQRIAEVGKLNRATTNLLKDLRAANRKLEEAGADLKIARDKAQEADRLKSAFLATMSHELRTPLNSIIGFSGVILQGLAGPLNPEQEKQLNMVYDSARHLLALINDVLDISKIEAGQLEIVAAPFDVRQAIAKALQTVTPLAEKKGLALVAAVTPGVGRITSDRRRVEQILINLVNNAIKFTDSGQVTIRAQSEIENRQSHIRIQVADTGIGIKPEDTGKLFAPFQQVETGLARPHEGTGLGLSICKKLVEMLGGEIWVESEWGVGSTFIFTLPLRRRNV